MNASVNAPLIGARVTRKEDYRFLTGTGQYTDDVALPNQSYAAFVRSPHAHAVLKKIDFEKAKKAPGVIADVKRGLVLELYGLRSWLSCESARLVGEANAHERAAMTFWAVVERRRQHARSC